MDFSLPEIGEGVYEAELVTWLVKPGDQVKRGQSLAEVLTDKASMELPSPFAGTIRDLKATPGNTIRVGEVVLSYQAPGDTSEAMAENGEPAVNEAPTAARAIAAATQAPTTTTVAFRSAGGQPPRAAPSVRLMARQLSVDLHQVRGTGPGGRILVTDVGNYVQTRNGNQARPAQPRPPAPQFDFGKPGTRVKLAGLRRKIADHMVLSKKTIPHYSYVDECDVTDLVKLRDTLKDTYSGAGIKLTYLAFVVKAVVAALKEFPIVNSSLDEASGEIILHDKYHVGVATATPGGLIVPVVRDADKLDVGQVAQAIERLSNDARQGKAKLEDLRGSTFTVTSIGSIGGMMATPVINHPEVGIVGIGKIVKRPVYDTQMNLQPADMLYLSFSFDHRVVDGAVGAYFANGVIKRLQKPATLLLPESLK